MMYLTRITLFTLMVAFLSLSLHADELGEAEQALNNGEYEQALTLFTKLAKEGEPGAEDTGPLADRTAPRREVLGNPDDKAKNPERARRYFRTAFDLAQPRALQGDPEAQHLIGMLYSSGKGVEKDIYAGADWLAKAGEGGNETAIRMLVHIYECGCRGLPKDDKKTEYWRAKLAALQ